ncbi:hypothetical protein [Lentzea sp. NPDC059081]|uniref:hypothetical protein n=1 Tax=Lentzea sp. NPDC059081 TaxID=3346719 RepID=UPI003688BCFF
MRQVVVGVHGINNHRPKLSPEEVALGLSRRWASALGGDVDMTVAYYAHHLHKTVQQSSVDPDLLDEEEQELLLGWATELLGPVNAMNLGLVPIRQLIEAMAGSKIAMAVAEPLITLATREVRSYLKRRDRRDNARDHVAGVVRERRPSVVIAHSLGSVVAYEALCANPDLEIDLLITLGSPLAIRRMVFDRLEPNPNGVRPVPRPGNVKRWVNVADYGDIVAVPYKLANAFQVDADLDVDLGLAFHKVEAYLESDQVRGLLPR